MNRITGSNQEDSLRARLVNQIIEKEGLHSRIYYFGQVISNEDPKNLNRIRVRIPVIDDVYYVDGTKEEGDARLPLCVPISHRFIDVPEVNSIVIVSIFDTKTPGYGRIYFDTITELSDTDIFNRVTPEINSLSDFDALEKVFGIRINKPKKNSYDTKDNVKYQLGIRGKGKNKFMLNKEDSVWTQNEGTQDESRITLSKNIALNASDLIDILSTKGTNKYHPVFDQPTFDYFASLNGLLKKIITLLNTVPAISPTGPCMPGKSAPQLMADLQKLATDFKKYRSNGSSKKITIN